MGAELSKRKTKGKIDCCWTSDKFEYNRAPWWIGIREKWMEYLWINRKNVISN